MRRVATALFLVIAGCQPVNPSIRNGYTVYRGHTTVTATVDPNIPKVEPSYPSDRR